MSESKASKKNKKRKNKLGKLQENEDKEISKEEMLITLKQELDSAKAEKNHNEAKILREQIWILSDLIAGVQTDVPQCDFDKILLSIVEKFNLKPSPALPTTASTSHETDVTKATSSETGGLEDRKLKNLRKKLEQIEKLKEKKNKGEKLEANQIDKINSEKDILLEIQEIEAIILKLNLT